MTLIYLTLKLIDWQTLWIQLENDFNLPNSQTYGRNSKHWVNLRMTLIYLTLKPLLDFFCEDYLENDFNLPNSQTKDITH